MPTIIPTVGRIVWMYHRNDGQLVLDSTNSQISLPPPGEPMMATICRVHADGTVNLGGFDAEGKPYAERHVTLLDPTDEKPEGGRYATWMPFQVNAAKAAAAPPVAASVSEGA